MRQTASESYLEYMNEQNEFVVRFRNALYTIFTGGLLFFGGFILAIFGDMGTNWPSYHAGWMCIGSIVIVGLYFVFELAIVPEMPFSPPRIQIAFLVWMLVGVAGLSVAEITLKSRCCSDFNIRQKISMFSMAWPTAFAIVAGVYGYIWRRNRGLLSGHQDYL